MKMLKKIKEYFVYRKQVKTAKKAIAVVGANMLLSVNQIAANINDVLQFAAHVAKECNTLKREELVSTIFGVLVDKFETDETRLYDIIKYMSTLDAEDIQKILVHAMVETNKEIKDKE